MDTLATVDMAPALHGEAGEQQVAQSIKRAAQAAGFFYLTNHGVPPEVIENAYSQLHKFFDLPLDAKSKSHTSLSDGVRGYIGLYEQGNYGLDVTDRREAPPEVVLMDAKEVFTLGQVLPKCHPAYHPMLFAENHWPSDPAFRVAIEAYYSEMERLAQRIYALFAVSLGLPRDYFISRTTATPMNSMNCLHYPPLPANAEPHQMGIGEHTDFECFTILSTDKTPGLQVLRDDGHWLDVAPCPDGFIVNIGDMMARWSNDLFKSTIHRARNRTNDHRYAIAFFCACDFGTVLTPLDPDAVAKYPPVKAGDHMLMRVGAANAPTQGPGHAASA